MKKQYWIIPIILIPFLVIMITLGLCSSAYKPTPFKTSISQNILTISNFGTALNPNPTKINLKDVTQIDYLKGFDIIGNDGGGSFGNTAVGDVILAKYGKVQAFVMNAEASGIIIDTPKENYIISCETKGETLALYEKLKSHI